MTHSSMGPLTLAIAALLLIGWLTLVVTMVSRLRGEDWEAPPRPLADQLYQALSLATTTPAPYSRAGNRLWHAHRTQENPLGLGQEECVGCVIDAAMRAYEAQRRAEREGEVEALWPGVSAGGL